MTHDAQFASQDSDALRSCINDLVGLLSLRSLLEGADLVRVADVIADVVAHILQPDFVFVYLFGNLNEPDCERYRSAPEPGLDAEAAVKVAARSWFESEKRLGIQTIHSDIAGRSFGVAAFDLGARGEFGFLFIGCDREGFPAPTERVLLNVAGSQALIALQHHRLLEDQRSVSARLDALVAQRSLELEMATEALRRREALMAQAEMVSLTGSFRWHPDTDALEWSAQAYALFGVPLDRQMTGEAIFERVHPDDHLALRAVRDRAQNTPIDLDVIFRVLPDGKEARVLHLVAHPATHESERGEYIGTIQDITERVSVEAASKAREIRLRELQDELSHANRLATVGQFSAAISHEVRQPLSSVVATAMAGLNWLNAPTPDLPSARRAFERVMSGSQRAADILERLRGYSRQRTPRGPVDLNALVSETIALVGADARRRRIQLKSELSPDLAPVMVDPVQIQQVVMNLIVNALDALEDDKSLNATVVVRTVEADDEVMVEIRDNGPGVPSEAQPNLFKAFHTTKPAGLGMGLSICQDIVADHAGRIWIADDESTGAVFRFAVPLATDPVTSRARFDHARPPFPVAIEERACEQRPRDDFGMKRR